MNFSKLIVLISALLVLSSCASIVSRSRYPILVKSNPPGARFTVVDKRGNSVYSGETPANFYLNAGSGYFSKGIYNLKIEMNGYETSNVPIQSSFDGWYIGNLLFGGIIGFLIVDPITGAMWKLDTQYISESLIPITAGFNPNQLNIIEKKDLPENWEDHLVIVHRLHKSE